MNEAELNHFNQFEEVEIRDAYTLASIAKARELENFMNAKPFEELTELEQFDLKLYAKDYIAAMNEACPYRGDRVVVSGEVFTGSYDEFEDKYSVRKATPINQEMTAEGYYALLKEDNEGRSRYVVGHYFISDTLEPREVGVTFVDMIPRLHSFAPVGSIDIIADVPEHRQAEVLSQSIPNVVERVNQQISQAKDKTDALRMLRHVVIMDAQNIPEETINDLCNYTYELLRLDEAVPYVVQLRGAVYQEELTEDGLVQYEHYDKASDELLVSPIELHLGRYPTKTDDRYELDDYDHFIVKLKVYGDIDGVGEHTILAPVRNIRRMVSLRELASSQRLTKKEK
jgi:hypothetical protein